MAPQLDPNPFFRQNGNENHRLDVLDNLHHYYFLSQTTSKTEKSSNTTSSLEEHKSFFIGFVLCFIFYFSFLMSSYTIPWSDSILQFSQNEINNSKASPKSNSFITNYPDWFNQPDSYYYPISTAESAKTYPILSVIDSAVTIRRKLTKNESEIIKLQENVTLWHQIEFFHFECHNIRCFLVIWITIISAIFLPTCYIFYHFSFISYFVSYATPKESSFTNKIMLLKKMVSAMNKYLKPIRTFVAEMICHTKDIFFPTCLTVKPFPEKREFSTSNLFVILIEKCAKSIIMIICIEELLQTCTALHFHFMSQNDNHIIDLYDHDGEDVLDDDDNNLDIYVDIQSQTKLGFVFFVVAANLGMTLIVLRRTFLLQRYLTHLRREQQDQLALTQQQNQMETKMKIQGRWYKSDTTSSSTTTTNSNVENNEEDTEIEANSNSCGNVVDPTQYIHDMQSENDNNIGQGNQDKDTDTCDDSSALQTPLLEDYDSYIVNHTSRALILPLSSFQPFPHTPNNIHGPDHTSDIFSQRVSKAEVFRNNNDKDGDSISTKATNQSNKRGLCWRLILYQSGGVAFLFLLPLFFFPSPLFRLEYSGLGALFENKQGSRSFMNGNLEIRSFVQDISFQELILRISMSSSSSLLGRFTNGIFILNMLIFPFLSFFLCLVIRYILPECLTKVPTSSNDGKSKVELFRILYPIMATINSFSTLDFLAISLFLTIPNMSQFTQSLFDDVHFCNSIISKWGEECLIIHGVCVAGSWYCFFQALMMNFFCDMTILEYEESYIMAKMML